MAYPHQHHVFDDTSGIAEVALRNGDRRDSGRDPAADHAAEGETRASSPTERED
jgi:hypothetical protein